MVTPLIGASGWQRLVLCVVIFFASSTIVSAVENLSAIDEYYGEYSIYSIKKVDGGITSDENALRWVGTRVCIYPNVFKIREKYINNPRYSIEMVRVARSDGEVMPRDISIFYGIEDGRSTIKRLLVFDGASAEVPDEKIEIIGDGRFLGLYDGRFYFFKRRSPEPSATPRLMFDR